MLTASAHGPITRIQLARTFSGRPLYRVSAYLVDGLLIDCGPLHTASELACWLGRQEVHQVINTHHHKDHSGANRVLADVLDLPLAAPGAAVPLLAEFPRLELYRRVVWGQPNNVVAQLLGATVDTRHFRFQVHTTPGHCPDHICLFAAEQGWLFSGDLFIHERAQYLRRDEDLQSLIRSLHLVMALRPKLLVCSYAGLVSDAVGALERKLAYWQTLGDSARKLRQSKQSLREITGRLLGREGMMTRVSRGHISKVNLIRALLDLDL